MFYIECYKYEFNNGTTKWRFAVYFRSEQEAYDAVQDWLFYNTADGFDVKKVEHEQRT